MSDEKELLLKLLVEKYLEDQEPKPAQVAKRNRNHSQDHNWTITEKAILAQMRREGSSWQQIANRLDLRVGQVRSMYSNLPMHVRFGKVAM